MDKQFETEAEFQAYLEQYDQEAKERAERSFALMGKLIEECDIEQMI
jgi:hypothetical protein